MRVVLIVERIKFLHVQPHVKAGRVREAFLNLTHFKTLLFSL